MLGEGGFVINNGRNSIQQARKSERERNINTISPLPISWLLKAADSSIENQVLTLDNICMDKICLVGRFLKQENVRAKSIITIEDGTGFIELQVNKKSETDIPIILQDINLK